MDPGDQDPSFEGFKNKTNIVRQQCTHSEQDLTKKKPSIKGTKESAVCACGCNVSFCVMCKRWKTSSRFRSCYCGECKQTQPKNKPKTATASAGKVQEEGLMMYAEPKGATRGGVEELPQAEGVYDSKKRPSSMDECGSPRRPLKRATPSSDAAPMYKGSLDEQSWRSWLPAQSEEKFGMDSFYPPADPAFQMRYKYPPTARAATLGEPKREPTRSDGPREGHSGTSRPLPSTMRYPPAQQDPQALASRLAHLGHPAFTGRGGGMYAPQHDMQGYPAPFPLVMPGSMRPTPQSSSFRGKLTIDTTMQSGTNLLPSDGGLAELIIDDQFFVKCASLMFDSRQPQLSVSKLLAQSHEIQLIFDGAVLLDIGMLRHGPQGTIETDLPTIQELLQCMSVPSRVPNAAIPIQVQLLLDGRRVPRFEFTIFYEPAPAPAYFPLPRLGMPMMPPPWRRNGRSTRREPTAAPQRGESTAERREPDMRTAVKGSTGRL